MERVWHLHPEQIGAGVFAQDLPDMPAGRYQIYADVVHQSGLPETLTAELQIPAIAGKPLVGDDSAGAGPAVSAADFGRNISPLPGGGSMVWDRVPGSLQARQVNEFRFH